MANPLFNAKTIDNAVSTSDAMTVTGTIGKSFLLAIITAGMAAVGWHFATVVPGLFIVCILLAFVIAIVAAFKPTFSPIAAPLYAILEGFAIGAISAAYAGKYQGIVLQALFITFGILFAMLTLYQTRIIRVTERVRSIIILATLGVAILYFANFIFQLFGVNLHLVSGSTGLSIGINIVIAVIASLNFLLDFDNIEKGAQAHAPKYMEWMAAMGLLITIIWLYLEILRLLAQLNGGDRR